MIENVTKPPRRSVPVARKILIIKLRAVGDVVLSTIVLKNLRNAYPQARIDFLTQDYCVDIVRDHPDLNAIWSVDLKTWQNQPLIQQIRSVHSFYNRIRRTGYDLVFDFFGNPRTAWITWYSGAPVRVGYDYRIRQWAYSRVIRSRADHIHEADWHLDALTALDIPVVSRALSVPVSADAESVAQRFWNDHQLHSERVVGINFSGGWKEKRWPLDRFAAVARRLVQEYQVVPLVIWGPGEEKEAIQLEQMIESPALRIPRTDLKELTALLNGTDLMISTDSGPMHIAAAREVPCVAIFGPTFPHLQGPYGSQHEIVYKDPKQFGCDRLECDHRACSGAVSVEVVVQAARRCIQKNKLWRSDAAEQE